MDGVQAAYAQLLGLGIPWMAIHCSGMCGPLVLGLRLGGDGVGGGTARVLLYQSGKALTYALLGALVGAAGQGAATVLKGATPVLGVLMAVGMVAAWWRGRHPVPAVVNLGRGRGVQQRFGDVLSRALAAFAQDSGAERAFIIGVLMGFLPCMIVGWALMLAAGTGSVVHGALVMVALAGMSTVPNLLMVLAPRLLASRNVPALAAMARHLPLLGASWMVLVSAAAMGWIEHRYVNFHVADRAFMLMFW